MAQWEVVLAGLVLAATWGAVLLFTLANAFAAFVGASLLHLHWGVECGTIALNWYPSALSRSGFPELKDMARKALKVKEMHSLWELLTKLSFSARHIAALLYARNPQPLRQFLLLTLVITALQVSQWWVLRALIGRLYGAVGATSAVAVQSALLAALIFGALVVAGRLLNRYSDRASSELDGEFKNLFATYFARIRTELGLQSFDGGDSRYGDLARAEGADYSARFIIPGLATSFRSAISGGANLVVIVAHLPLAGLALGIGLMISTTIELYGAVRKAQQERVLWRTQAQITEWKKAFETRERLRAIFAFGMADIVLNHVDKLTNKMVSQQDEDEKKQFRLDLVALAVLSLVMFPVGYYVITAVVARAIPASVGVMLVAILPSTIMALNMAAQSIARQSLGADQIYDMFKFVGEPLARERALAGTTPFPRDVPADIDVAGLTFRYNAESKPALSNMTVTIPAGKEAVICAPSGDGKSTSFDIFTKRIQAEGGMVRIGGVDITAIRRAELQEVVLSLPQDPLRPVGTVRQVLTFAGGFANPSDCPEKILWKALELACFADKVRSLPRGLNESLSYADNTRTGLSGGEQRRLNIAMLFVKLLVRDDVKVIILDEPFEGIDAALAAEIHENFRKFQQLGATLVVSTHHTREVDEDAWIIFFRRDENGQTVVYEDTRRNLEQHCEPFRRYSNMTQLRTKDALSV